MPTFKFPKVKFPKSTVTLRNVQGQMGVMSGKVLIRVSYMPTSFALVLIVFEQDPGTFPFEIHRKTELWPVKSVK